MSRRQCADCPWKKTADPRKIRGYSVGLHKGLATTIAEPGALIGGSLRVFVCHKTHDLPCAGWLVNQLGPGNNIPLRLACSAHQGAGRIDANVETVGEQHETFEDTMPRKSRRL